MQGVIEMRTEQEMMDIILSFADKDKRIRIVGMEGSRTNKNIPKDDFQDYDITFFVDDINEYTNDDGWLSYFGNIIMMQKPEDMELFPVEEPGYSYIMYFDDYNKMDLTLRNIEDINEYLTEDKLKMILLDKDSNLDQEVIPTDEDYHIKKPTAREFDDCCNEFWSVTPYVVKGLCRKEILFAIDHVSILQHELLRMVSWKVGIEFGFNFSIGKNYKFLDKYISKELWERILSTYRTDTYENTWNSLFQCLQIFREISVEVSQKLGYEYPNYDKNISKYVGDMYREYKL